MDGMCNNEEWLGSIGNTLLLLLWLSVIDEEALDGFKISETVIRIM